MTEILSANTDTPNVIRGPSIKLLGEIRAIMRNPDGSIAQDTGWIKNRILDQGLFMMGQSNVWASRGFIGSSAAPVVDSQTSMQSWLGNSSSVTFVEQTVQAVAPNYEGYEIQRYRFNAGVGTGTVREFGVGLNSDAATRVLVTPEMPKSAIQVLDVYYKMTCYPDLSTYTGTINILTNGVNESYNVTSRGQSYGTQYLYAKIFSTPMASLSGGIGRRFMDGNIGAGVTGYPSGQTAGGYPNYLGAGYLEPGSFGVTYSAGPHSCYKDIYLDAGLDTGNIASGLGIRSAYIDFAIGWDWGCQYDRVSDGSRILKDNTKVVQLNYRYTWSRL